MHTRFVRLTALRLARSRAVCVLPPLAHSRTLLAAALLHAAAGHGSAPVGIRAFSMDAASGMATASTTTIALPATFRGFIARDGACVQTERPLSSLMPNTPETRSHVLIRVHYTALNRADTLQRKGAYPPPAGATDILGLEATGTVEAVGSDVTSISPGDRVMCLLPGGGHATYVSVRSDTCVRVPSGMSFHAAAAVPEAWITAYMLLHFLTKTASYEGQTVLIHAAGSGVGTALVQLSAAAGARRVIAVAGDDDKLELTRRLGATHTVNYKTSEDWAAEVQRHTEGAGAHVILDPVGGSFFRGNADVAAMDAVWILYGSMGGVAVPTLPDGKNASVLAPILRKRLRLQGTTLRNRADAYKAELVAEFAARVLPRMSHTALSPSQIIAGAADASIAPSHTHAHTHTHTLLPIVSAEFPLTEAGVAAAHAHIESNASIGKILLRVES